MDADCGCEESETCLICYGAACSKHGQPDARLGELVPADTVTFCLREGGGVHRECHDLHCRARACAAEAA